MPMEEKTVPLAVNPTNPSMRTLISSPMSRQLNMEEAFNAKAFGCRNFSASEEMGDASLDLACSYCFIANIDLIPAMVFYSSSTYHQLLDLHPEISISNLATD